MYVDKERAAKVLEYMKSTNTSWVNSGVQSKAALQLDPKARFSFHKFLTENNLLVNPMERNGDIWIECPFHDDVNPSCSINEQKYVYHCFSCGSKGNLISLIAGYRNKFESSGLGYYQVMNSILAKDRIMQADLGFNSIYTNATLDDFDFEKALKPIKFVPPVGKVYPSSYCELADILVKRKATINQMRLFVILMQNHVSAKEIYKEVFNETDINEPDSLDGETGTISLEELMTF